MRDVRNAFWFLLAFATMMLLVPTMALSFGGGGDATATSSSSSSALGIGVGVGYGGDSSASVTSHTINNPNQSQSLNMKVDAPSGGVYRQFPEPVQPLLPGVPGWFLGPVGKSWNIMENLEALPHQLTRGEAESLLGGDVKAEVRLLRKVSYQTDRVKLFKALPEKYRLIGYVFIESNGTTIDAVAKAALVAMEEGVGADGLVLLNRSVSNQPYGWGAGVGIGSGISGLRGDDERNYGVTVGGILGFSYGKAGVKVGEGFVFMLIDTDPKPMPLRPAKSTKKASTDVKPDAFRCVATATYIPPADCK